MRLLLSACLLALLAFGICAVRATTSCMGGLKSLFCKDDSTYVKFANKLYGRTHSASVADNVKAAQDMMAKLDGKDPEGEDWIFRPHHEPYEKLAMSLARLPASDDETSTKALCHETNIHNLRLLAEAMQQEGGNLDAKHITKPVRKLNQLIIRMVASARSMCFGLLHTQWAALPKPDFSTPRARARIHRLGRLSLTALFGDGDGHVPMRRFASELANTIAEDQVVTGKLASEDSTRKQVAEIFEAPCGELLGWRRARLLLEAYVELLLASHVIDPARNQMDRFYADGTERPAPLGPARHNAALLNMAYAHRACSNLRSMDKDRLARLINESWQK